MFTQITLFDLYASHRADCHTASSELERPTFVDVRNKQKAKPFLQGCAAQNGSKAQQRCRSRNAGAAPRTRHVLVSHVSRCHLFATCPHACGLAPRAFGRPLAGLQGLSRVKQGIVLFIYLFFWKANRKDLVKLHQYIKFPGSNICSLGEEEISNSSCNNSQA